jgi:hypothetical protein
MKRCAKTCVLIGLLAAPAASLPQVAGTLSEAPESSIGYETVAAALKAVQAKQGMETRVENGWLVVIDTSARIIWSFAPQGHPAYPTAVKRTVVPTKEGRSTIETKVLCESDKVSCDTVVLQFQDLTNRALGRSR